jgi:hypothetical protein
MIIGVRNDIVAIVLTNAGFITSLGVNIPYARNQSSKGTDRLLPIIWPVGNAGKKILRRPGSGTPPSSSNLKNIAIYLKVVPGISKSAKKSTITANE